MTQRTCRTAHAAISSAVQRLPHRFVSAQKLNSGLDDLPPEARKQLEQTLKQMRDSGMLEDKNRDGIPDRLETPLRIAGWVGKLTGNPHLKERIQQQMKASA